MGRALRLTSGYQRSFARLSITWSAPVRRSLLATLAGLSTDELPGAQDYEALIPPTARAWVRRVPSCNLWVFYRFDAAEVRAVALVGSPPVPVIA